MTEMFQGSSIPTELKCKIIAYRGDRTACWYYRVHLPMSFITKNHPEYGAIVTDRITTDQAGHYDIAILQRQHYTPVYDKILKIQAAGCKVIYEVDDDLFNIPAWNSAHAELGKKSTQDGIKRTMSISNALFVSTEELAKVYKNYCEKIYVLPNSIAFEGFFKSPRNSAKQVVCWQGSSTHTNDLKIIQPAIERIIGEGYCMKMMGDTLPGAYAVPPVEFKSFYQMFSQLDGDVGLAPIIPHMFNRSKSNLKFLEYASQGIACVASDFGPYASTIVDGETGLLVSNNKEWYDKIKYLLDNDEERNKIINNAYNFVKENCTYEKNYLLWKAAIDEVQTTYTKGKMRWL